LKAGSLSSEVRKQIGKIRALVSADSPPELILNRHCAVCEFQSRCRQKAIETDDLSLLANMSKQERKQYNSKGILTVRQLSFAFRPRRRPKHLREKREKYHHSLKALAIREKQNPHCGQAGTDNHGDTDFLRRGKCTGSKLSLFDRKCGL